MADEEQKKESIWKFYFQARWQTGLTSHFLLILVYLILFYAGNIWAAFKFGFFTFVGSARLLGLDFAAWGVIFTLSAVLPFISVWYAIFLLPKIWQASFSKWQKVFLTIILLIAIPSIITIADTVARYTLDAPVLREFVRIHNIEL